MSSLSADATKSKPEIQRGWLAQRLHWIFEASLLIKGLLASSEAIGGLGLLLAPNMMVLRLVAWLTRHQLTQNPTEEMALWFRHLAEQFPIQTQHFYAWYLMGHGLLKLAMVGMLARRVLSAYPLAMAILAGFVIYQLHEYGISHSPVLLVLSGFDAFMIALVFREFREMRAARTTMTAPQRALPTDTQA